MESNREKNNDRYVRFSMRSVFSALLIVALLAAIYYLKELIFVFLTSIVIASFVESGVRRLSRYGVGRTLSVVLIYFLVLSFCGFLMYLFVPVFMSQISQFSLFIEKYLPPSATAFSGDNTLPDIIRNFQSITSDTSGGVLQFAILIFGGLYNFVILIVLSFYLSMNERAVEMFLRVVAPQRDSDVIVGLWKRVERKIGLWFQGQLLLALLVGILLYLGLLIFNVQYSLLLAVVAAVLELIPFGIILAAVPAVAAGFMSHGSTGAFEVAGLYLIVHEFEINLISPLIVQRIVGVSSLVVILSILVGLKIAGFWGIVLAIPFAVLLMELMNDIKKKKGLIDD